MRNFRIGTTLLAAAAVSSALLLSGCDNDDSLSSSRSFPEQLENRVFLRAGENLRVTRYVPGTNVRLDGMVDYKSGETGELSYRTEGPGAGNLKSAKIFYTASDGSEHGAIKRELELDVDGITFIRDRSYFPDGTLQRRVDKISDHSSESTDFYADGGAIEQHRVFIRKPDDYSNKGWRIAAEETYRADGTLNKKFVLNADNSSVADEFSGSEVLISHTVTNQFQSQRDTVVYEEDGKAVIKTVEQNSSTKIKLFDGTRVTRTLSFGWEYSFYSEEFFDAAGKVTMKRFWYQRSGIATPQTKAGKVTPANFYLGTVDIFNAAGVEIESYSWNQKGQMDSLDISSADGKTSTVYVLKDGRLMRTITRTLDPVNVGKPVEYDPPIAFDLPKVDAKYTEPVPFGDLPATLPNAQPYRGPGGF